MAKVFEITDGKSVYDGGCREVVIESGKRLVDIIYNFGAWRAKYDLQHIKSELIAYGEDKAFELAEWIRDEQKFFEESHEREQELLSRR